MNDEKWRLSGGRPKNRLAVLIEDACSELGDDGIETYWRQIIKMARTQAAQGDWRAREWLADRRFGKAVEHVELETDVQQLSPAERAAKLVELVEKAQAYLLTRRLLTTEKDDAENG